MAAADRVRCDGQGREVSRRVAVGTMLGGAAALAIGAPGGGRWVAAQQGTPTATAVADPKLGTPVSFISVEGIEIGRITVDRLIDPFTGYRPNAPPPRGHRFILLRVTAENVWPNPWPFDPGRIMLLDGQGFLFFPTSVDLGDQPAEPALTYQEIPPATTVAGVLGYVMLQGVQPIRVFFMPAGDRLLLLADLR